MIDVQRQIKEMLKTVVEMNITMTEIENLILTDSIKNWTVNTTNIVGMLENLQYLIQSDMENRVFQIQWMLANELDAYKRKGNNYVDENIQEIQKLYISEE